MQNRDYIVKVICSCKTLEQLNCAYGWALRVIQNHYYIGTNNYRKLFNADALATLDRDVVTSNYSAKCKILLSAYE